MGFDLSLYPVIYKSQYNGSQWEGQFIEKEPMKKSEEEALSPNERSELKKRRNRGFDLPLINYTTQYSISCFEGLKGFPQRDGSLKVFRPDKNGTRMHNSMKGLMMPPFPADKFTNIILEGLIRNREWGYTVDYNPQWEKDSFQTAGAIYIRPFAYTEGGIGVSLSQNPYFIVVMTPVTAYFNENNHDVITSKRIRAVEGGTGWIKCASNYTVSTIAKAEAVEKGYMEAIFLDQKEKKYIEEGSSCNFFCLLNSGTLVTPDLKDTILPGITRESIITLAKEMGIPCQERPLSYDEVLSDGKECFVSGTAAGLSYITSFTHDGKRKVFGESIGEVTSTILNTLKGIQYGTVEDKHNWMVPLS